MADYRWWVTGTVRNQRKMRVVVVDLVEGGVGVSLSNNTIMELIWRFRMNLILIQKLKHLLLCFIQVKNSFTLIQ
jgi:hypothetical protein